MLNRNNLTLSALSNRLNLGTRSFVLSTNVNIGTALRIRHAYQDAMHDAAAADFVADSSESIRCVPLITGPTTMETSHPTRCGHPMSPAVADASPFALQTWRGWLVRPSGSSGRRSSSSFRSQVVAVWRRLEAERRFLKRLAAIAKAEAAGAASSRTAKVAAIAAVAGS